MLLCFFKATQIPLQREDGSLFLVMIKKKKVTAYFRRLTRLGHQYKNEFILYT